MKKVLVTGACGFIGSHLAEQLVREGYSVKAFVFYNSFNSWGWLDEASPEVQKSIEIISGDVRDAYAVREAVRGCDTVFHLAALIGIPYSYHAPDNYLETNARGTLNILQAAREFGTRVVHTSTSEVYGTAKFVPITEEHPLQGQSPYSASKIAADQMAMSFYHSFKSPVTIVRPFNTFGPRQSARAIIPTTITQLLNGARKIQAGSLFPTRDFTFIDDTVQGFIAAGKADQALGEVLNLGTGFEISIGDLIQMIATLTESQVVEIVNDPNRVRPTGSEVERLLSANAKAQRLLGWRPKLAGKEGLREGLRKTMEWFKDKQNLSKYKFDRYNI